MQGLNKALRLERKGKKSVIITTSSSTDLSSAFYLVQCESLLAPFPEKNSFRWIMQQKQQEGEIMK